MKGLISKIMRFFHRKHEKVALYRVVDDELAYWGHYNLENESELNAYTEAVWQFACNGYRVKAVRVEQ